MKSLIHIRTERNYEIKAERVVIRVLGLCIYMHEYPMDSETKPRSIGFVQHPSSAGEVEDEDYYPEED